ncbi:hypothetical protein AAD018_004275 [Aestuariibius insulae]|uniref:hypothetical protein n=1 Tax=Aestuariibius insulae TaxID=2058287 RepID=UPI00345E253F
MSKRELLIDGIKPDEIVNLDDLDAYTLAGRPIVFSVGEAKVLAEFSKSGKVLTVEIAVVEQGGEGVFPVLINTIERAVLKRDFAAIEWSVLARNCSTPNPKLMRVLEKIGFEVRQLDSGTEFYWQRRSINDSLLRRVSR